MVIQHELWDMAIMDTRRKHGAGWPKGERLSMFKERKRECGGWKDMRRVERIRNVLLFRRGLVVLER
jgi:hypothetical protein